MSTGAPAENGSTGWRRQVRVGELLRPHLPAAVALTALVLFLFRDVVFRGQVFFHRDVHLQWYVQALAFVRSVFAGSWPVWNPWVSFGQPLWANPNNQVLYPFTWLHLIMQPWTYYTCFVVAHFLFSAAGMYALGRRLGLSRSAATVSAAVWVASGPFLSLVDLWNHLAASAWIPWMFLAADVALASGRPIAALAWGGTLAVPVITGSPDTGLMAGLALAVYAVRYLRWREPLSRPNLRVAATAAGALAFALAISAAQWWPSLELLRRSPRFIEVNATSQAFWSIHPVAILQAFLPAYPERLPLSWEAQAEYFEGREAYLRSLYLGLCSFGLVLAGAEGRRRRLWLFFALVAAAAGVLALGRHTPAYGAALAAIPPLRTLRFPAKAMVPMAFAWAAMAGIGFDAWRNGPGTRGSRVLIAAVLALGALVAGGLALTAHLRAEEWGSAFLYLENSTKTFTSVLAPTARGLALAAALALAMALLVLARSRPGPRTERLAGGAALVLLADLVSVHHRLNLTAAREVFTYRPPILDVVRPHDRARIYVYDYFEAGKAERYLGHRSPYLTRVRQEDWPISWMGALALRSALFPTVAGSWGLETAFDRDALGLYPTPLGMLTNGIREIEGTPLHTRLLRLGAVEYVVALHRQGFGDLVPVATLPSVFVEPLFVFRVPDPLPRAYAVGEVRRVDSVLAEARMLVEPSFDPTREIVLPAGPASPVTASFSGSTRIVEFRPDRVRLEAELSAPGYVMVVDAYDPGWRATVDGRPAEVLRANVAFRAVAVPAGKHVVEHRYRPRSVTGGLLASGAALLAALVVAGADARRRRPPARGSG
jgi:hypothetical protein